MPRILIVDDEETIRASVQTTAAEEGYEVFLAENGADALKLVETIEPMKPHDRLAFLVSHTPNREVQFPLRHRYFALAIAVNLPG